MIISSGIVCGVLAINAPLLQLAVWWHKSVVYAEASQETLQHLQYY